MSWSTAMAPVLASPQYEALKKYLAKRTIEGVRIYPKDVFRPLREVPLDRVSVVILGEEPYCLPGQANGLAFAVDPGKNRPPLLRNVLAEVAKNIDTELHKSAASLLGWVDQGVLLLNSSLTVEEGRPGSHADIGWDFVVDHIIKTVSEKEDPCAFLLWGASSIRKAALINKNRHLILEAASPATLELLQFQGCRHFKLANDFLVSSKRSAIDWSRIDRGQESVRHESLFGG